MKVLTLQKVEVLTQTIWRCSRKQNKLEVLTNGSWRVLMQNKLEVLTQNC